MEEAKKPKKEKVFYDPKFCQEVVDHMKLGNSFTSWCSTVPVSRTTGIRWTQSHEEFHEAHQVGEVLLQKWWEDVGRKGMVGGIKGFHASVWIFTMKNRFNWSDKLESRDSGEKKAVSEMTDAELKEHVAKLIPFNKAAV